jgi:hypothetical protein
MCHAQKEETLTHLGGSVDYNKDVEVVFCS